MDHRAFSKLTEDQEIKKALLGELYKAQGRNLLTELKKVRSDINLSLAQAIDLLYAQEEKKQ